MVIRAYLRNLERPWVGQTDTPAGVYTDRRTAVRNTFQIYWKVLKG